MSQASCQQLLQSMSVREKIGQTAQECLTDLLRWENGDLAAALQKYPAGSIFVGSDVVGQKVQGAGGLSEMIGACQRVSRLPLSVAGDLENGAGGAVRGMTAFPPQLCLGATDSEELAYEYGKLTAVESVAAGFNWTFGPVADLLLNWLAPAVGPRGLGSDPERVSALLTALIRGFQEHGLSATAKHFPGDGTDFRDQHLITSINSLNEADWFATFGRVYAACFKAGVHSIMAGHIALPWLDRQTGRGGRPRPGTVSPLILTDLLRGRLGFDGIVVSDALIMAGYTGWAGYEQRTLAAINAGVDVMLWPGRPYYDLLERALDDGRLRMQRLDEMVLRILQFKERQGILGRPAASVNAQIVPDERAQVFARTVAAKGITLVRNEAGLLPLSPQKNRDALILFATANPDAAERTLQPLLNALAARGVRTTLHVNGNCLDLYRMEEAGKQYDTFLSVWQIGMHTLKNTIRPAGAMAECLWTQQNTDRLQPVVISLGTPYLLNEMPYADTLVNAYGAAPAALEELVAILYGEQPFRGRSPVETGGAWVNPAMGWEGSILPAN